jgi:tetratricopeptide (TPR) repeat protein
MNTRFRAASSGVAAAIVALAMAGPAFAQPLSTKSPGGHPGAIDVRAAQAGEPATWLRNLKSWLEAVSEHRPGENDVPARRAWAASEMDLEAVRVDFLALLAVHKRALESSRGGRASNVTYKNVPFTPSGIQALLGLTNQEAARSDANRILKRAAILHGDVEMLVAWDLPESGGCSTQSVMVVRDGLEVGSRCIGIHWAQGRALLDAIAPDPRKEPLVALWYQATIAFLLERTDYANGVRQIDHGSALFPDDPDLLFEHGYYHEIFASRSFRPAVLASKSDLRSVSAHLKEAEDLFRRALVASPGLIEARLHHGAVLGALGRHDEAARELRQAATSAPEGHLRYYAELFLGDEEQALGLNDVARAHYRAAAARFPLAQSPGIALSALERRSGDRGAALAHMRHVFSLAAARQDRRADPWWAYYYWFARDAASRLRDLYDRFAAGDAR